MSKRLVVGALAVAVWAPVLAVPSVGGDHSVPETLRRIDQQTKATGTQVSDPVSGLAAVHRQVELLGSTTEGGLGQLLKDIAALKAALSDLRSELSRPPGAASRVWVSPYWSDWDSGGDGTAHLIHPSRVVALNPGEATAQVGCLYFDAPGRLLLERGASMTIGRGATATCQSFQVPSETPIVRDKGWVLVTSDRPILVYGWYQRERGGQDLHREVMHFFPVDCSRPEGSEFVCQFAPPGQ